MKKPSVRSRSGRSLQEARVVRRRQSAGARRRGRSPPSPRVGHRAAPRSVLVLAPGDRAGRVDERAARGERPDAPRSRMRAWTRGAARSISSGDLRQRASGPRRRAFPGLSRADPRGRDRSRRRGRARRRRRLDHGTPVAPSRARSVSASSAGPARVALDGDDARRGCPSGRRSRSVLIPGAGAEVEHPLARLRVEHRDDRLRARATAGRARPVADQRAARRLARRRRRRAPRAGRAARAVGRLDSPRLRSARREAPRGSACSVLTAERRLRAARSWPPAASAPRARPSSSHHSLGEPFRVRSGAIAAPAGVASSRPPSSVVALARRARRRTALTRPAAAPAAPPPDPLASSTAWSTAAWSAVASENSSS